MVTWIRSRTRSRRTRPAHRKPGTFRPVVEGMEERCLLSNNFLQTNLVSDIAGLAATTDPQLINPWGLTSSGGSPFWVSDNQTGFSTLYNGQGAKQGLVVNIPNLPGSGFTHATPTGTVFNTDTNSTDFQVTDGTTKARSIFLFAALDGTIDGWNGASNNAINAVPASNGSIYTGLAIDTSTSAGNTLLYAADWWNDSVNTFNSSFTQINKGAFQDPAIPSDFHPFNVQDLNGHIFVTYAQFDPATSADTGTGGFVAEFTRDGALETTIKGDGHFNSPWGVALAPAGFGDFGGDLLVGNFGGDGHINAFDPKHHFHFAGALRDGAGTPIAIGNLWALRFGNGGAAGSPNTLFFTAGVTDAPATIFGATDGLLGSLQAIPRVNHNAPLVPKLPEAATQTFSTVPANGDLNPYGVAYVPSDFAPGGGPLHPGDLLVSNFNSSSNLQGTGTTIVQFGPNGQNSVFFQGPQGIGLTTALGVLKSGFVIVGNVPTTDGTAATIQAGSLIVLDRFGHEVLNLTDSALLDGPWDLTINDRGSEVQVFVSNVLSGTVTRIDLDIVTQGTALVPMVESETQIASGYLHRPDMAALVIGPTGLAYDAKRDILYVASTGDNAIFAIPHAGTRQEDAGMGRLVYHDNVHLHGPLGLVLAPNGDLITANGDAINPDAAHPSTIVEFTPAGRFVSEFSLNPGFDAAFGIALQQTGRELKFAAVDDNTNQVHVFTIDQNAPHHRSKSAHSAVHHQVSAASAEAFAAAGMSHRKAADLVFANSTTDAFGSLDAG
jgi:uncharacterized protein (TIGR03118 family)